MLAHGASRGTGASTHVAKPQRGDTRLRTRQRNPFAEAVSPLPGLSVIFASLSHGSRRGLACCAPLGLVNREHLPHTRQRRGFPSHFGRRGAIVPSSGLLAVA